MIALLWFLLTLFASPLKSKSRLEAENAALRYQLIVLRRKVGELPPRKHTLQLVLGDWSHLPFHPPIMSDVITITVK